MCNGKALAVLIFLTAIDLVVLLTFNGLGGAGKSGLFQLSIPEIAGKYVVYITAAGWTFSVWGIIYIFLIAGAAYSVSTVFRHTEEGGPAVYAQEPVVLNWVFYLALLANYILNTAWIFTFLNDLLVAATIIICFVCYTGWLAFGVACYRGERSMMSKVDSLTRNPALTELRWQRVIIHNGLATYSTWLLIASIISINMSVQYIGGGDAEITSLVCLSVLLVIAITWFVLENTIWDRYVRYTLAQYPVLMWASGGVLSFQLNSADRPDGTVPLSVQILTWIVLGISSTLFIARIVLVIYRYHTKPLFTNSFRTSPQEKK